MHATADQHRKTSRPGDVAEDWPSSWYALGRDPRRGADRRGVRDLSPAPRRRVVRAEWPVAGRDARFGLRPGPPPGTWTPPARPRSSATARISVAAQALTGSMTSGSWPPTLFAISQMTNQSTVMGVLSSRFEPTARAPVAGHRCGARRARGELRSAYGQRPRMAGARPAP